MPKKPKKKYSNYKNIREQAPVDNFHLDQKKTVKIPKFISVKEFSERADLPVAMIITKLISLGVLATINETIDFDTAAIVGEELNLEVVQDENITQKETEQVKVTNEKELKPRPPVVTIMGHVDHGKTTLLDKIRSAHVAEYEHGGITQHITAYQVTLKEVQNKELKNRTITFIDTPGHAAFSAMRKHGAAITDIVVLIVAATDGVMPQTKEVIEQVKANKVPIIVAINKVDMPGADILKTKQQLSDEGLLPEDWGGDTVMVEISAKTGQGVDQLLEILLLQADLLELKANPNELANGIVIESHMEKGSGPMAVVLIESGTLRRGQPISIGSSYGRVKRMENFAGELIESASPSEPVRVSGLKSLPDFGERMLVFESDKEARENSFKQQKLNTSVNIATAKRVDESEKAEVISLNLIIKSDVTGSLEAIKKSISEIKSDEIVIKTILDGVGNISESDITLAKATNSVIVGFRVGVSGAAKRMAEKEAIEIGTFQVIYELIDFIKSKASQLLPPEIIEEELGEGVVLAIFRDDKKAFVAGGKLKEGKASVGDEIKFLQNKNEKFKAKILSLRKEKSEAKEISTPGIEFGFGLPHGANVAVNDKFIVYKTISRNRSIE